MVGVWDTREGDFFGFWGGERCFLDSRRSPSSPFRGDEGAGVRSKACLGQGCGWSVFGVTHRGEKIKENVSETGGAGSPDSGRRRDEV